MVRHTSPKVELANTNTKVAMKSASTFPRSPFVIFLGGVRCPCLGLCPLAVALAATIRSLSRQTDVCAKSPDVTLSDRC